MKKLHEAILGIVGAGGLITLYLGMGFGWLYWIYIGVKLGSFGMVIFAILGPIGFVCSILGIWSFIFGIPLWLLHWVT
jgi:hypothetical protein